MSPEAIRSLVGLFGVEKGLCILNHLAAPNDIEMARRPRETARDRTNKKAVSPNPCPEEANDHI